jgi:hypothetical protein
MKGYDCDNDDARFLFNEKIKGNEAGSSKTGLLLQ